NSEPCHGSEQRSAQRCGSPQHDGGARGGTARCSRVSGTPRGCRSGRSRTDRVMLDRSDDEPSISPVGNTIDSAKNSTDPKVAPLAWALSEMLQTDEEVRQNLVALNSGMRPPRTWRAPLYRSNRIAIETGIRASAQFAVASALFALAGWADTSIALSIVVL